MVCWRNTGSPAWHDRHDFLFAAGFDELFDLAVEFEVHFRVVSEHGAYLLAGSYRASSSATTLARRSHTLSCLLLGFGFGHDAHERLGAGRTQQHAAGVAQQFLRVPPRPAPLALVLAAILSTFGTLMSVCGSWGSRRPVPLQALTGFDDLVA